MDRIDKAELSVLRLAEEADELRPHLRSTVIFLLKSGITSCYCTAALAGLFVVGGMIACWAQTQPPMVTDSVCLSALWSLLWGGFGIMGALFFHVQMNTVRVLKETLFLRRLIWTEVEDDEQPSDRE